MNDQDSLKEGLWRLAQHMKRVWSAPSVEYKNYCS